MRTIIVLLLVFWSNQVEAKNSLHMIDVGEGQAVLIKSGTWEVLIDGGYEAKKNNSLIHHLNLRDMIDGPLDLLVITHGDREAWYNLPPFLDEIDVDEIWTPGLFEEDTQLLNAEKKTCHSKSYIEFHNALTMQFPDKLKSPIQDHIKPFVSSKDLGSSTAPIVSEAKLFLLNAGTNTENCTFRKNDGAIALAVELGGVKIVIGSELSSGQTSPRAASGKKQEERLVEAMMNEPWFKGVDILIAPRKGSSTASSDQYRSLLAPRFVLFGSASTHGNPAKAVFDSYYQMGARILTTAHSTKGGKHNISCIWSDGSDLSCGLGNIVNNHIEWAGIAANGEKLTVGQLDRIISKNKRRRVRVERGAFIDENQVLLFEDLKGAILTGVDLSGKDLSHYDLSNTDLSHAQLHGTYFDQSRLDNVNVSYSNMSGASFLGSEITNANVEFANFSAASFRNARIGSTVFDSTNLSGARFEKTRLEAISFKNVTMTEVVFEPENLDASGLKKLTDLDDLDALDTLQFVHSPSALLKLRKYYSDAGLRKQARQVTYAIEVSKDNHLPFLSAVARKLLFKATTSYGRSPHRPLLLILLGIPLFAGLYALAIVIEKGASLYKMPASGGGPSVEKLSSPDKFHTLHTWKAYKTALYFSLISAFHIGYEDINIGTWVQRIAPVQYNIDATGWVRVVSGVQSILSFLLIVLWLILLFKGTEALFA